MRLHLVTLPFVAALFLAPAGDLAAQDSASTRVSVGDDVKLRSRALSGRFLVAALDPARLTLSRRDGEQHIVEVDSIASLKVARGRYSRGAGAWRGFLRGFALGAIVGAAAGYSEGDADPGFLSFTAEEKAALGAIVVGGLGGAVGITAGALFPGERWMKVPLTGLRGSVSASGTTTIGFVVRF